MHPLVLAFTALAIFLVTVLVLSTASHFFVPVQYVRTQRAVRERMAKAADLRPGHIVFDLGAGDGELLRSALHTCPGIHAVAVEAVPSVYLWGRLHSMFHRDAIEWRFGSLFQSDVRNADRVLLYLHPRMMRQLGEKFDAELTPGTRVVSHDFPFPDRTPIATHGVPAGYRDHQVYVYDWPAQPVR